MRVFFNIFAISFLILLSPNLSHANQGDSIPPPGLELNSRSVTSSLKLATSSIGLPLRGRLETIVLDALKYILSLVGFIAFILLVYAGFKWMTAGGDSSAVEQAREIALTTVAGLLVIAFSLSMVGFVGQAIDSIFGKGDRSLAVPTPVLSATSQVVVGNFKLADPKVIAARAIVFLLGVAGFIAIVFVIYGGTRWMLALGDDKAVSAGKTIIINSLGGLVLVMLAYGITVFTLEFVASLAPNKTNTSKKDTFDISKQTLCLIGKPPEKSGCGGVPGEFTCKEVPDQKLYTAEDSTFIIEIPGSVDNKGKVIYERVKVGYCEKNSSFVGPRPSIIPKSCKVDSDCLRNEACQLPESQIYGNCTERNDCTCVPRVKGALGQGCLRDSDCLFGNICVQNSEGGGVCKDPE